MMLNGTPPHDLRAEQEFLGAVLLVEAIPCDAPASNLEPADFYQPSHGRLWAAMQALQNRSEAITATTLANELDREGHLRAIGGRAAVDSLVGPASVSAIGTHGRTIREKARERKVRELAAQVYERPGDAAGLRALQEAALAPAQSSTVDADSLFAGEPMDPAAQKAEPLPTLPGFPFAHAGTYILISGPTGAGRSSLVQACLFDAARGCP